MSDNKTENTVSSGDLARPDNFYYEGAHSANRKYGNLKGGPEFLSSNSPVSLAALEESAEKAKLEQESWVDKLTGLYNRRYFDQKLEELRGKDRGLLFVDMDGLKQANDLTGSHAVGDRMLRLIADEMRSVIRERESEKDFICRVGGDEFAIIFANKISPEVLGRIASRLNNLVNNHVYQVPEESGVRKHIALSISIGGSVGGGDMDTETLKSNADKALYQAKQTKNAAIIFGLEK